MALDIGNTLETIRATIKVQTTTYKTDQLAVAVLFKAYEHIGLAEGYLEAATGSTTKKEY